MVKKKKEEKSSKTLQKPAKKVKNLKGRFEVADSKFPLKYKNLYDLEDKVLSENINSHITSTLLSSHNSLFKSLYSTEFNWLDYSSLLYNIYEVRSLKAYVGIKKFDYVSDIYSDQINNLYNDFIEYYENTLKLKVGKISNTNKLQLKNTCVWLIFHLNRSYSNGYTGLKFSYWVNFYTSCQDLIKDEEKIGGTFVKRLVDFLYTKEMAYFYKGYKLKSTYRKSFGMSKGYYSGEDKSCMSLLVFDYSRLGNYILKQNKTDTKFKPVLKDPNEAPLYIIRKESKSKEVIPESDYKESWMSVINLTEKVLHTQRDLLSTSKVRYGDFLIPEIYFTRIWIGSVDEYGRVHDDGSFQTKSKSIRVQLLIDDEETTTIDLSSLHPRILYTQEGIELPEDFDPYPSVNIKLDKSRIRRFKNFYNLENYNPVRNLVKVALLILLNSKSENEAKFAIKEKLLKDEDKLMTRREGEMSFVGIPKDLDITDLIEKIKRHNKGISKYFSTNISMKLMNKDSDIIIDAIDSLNSLNIVCLPLHDSITVKRSCKEEAKKALEYGYKSVMGTLMNFKCEEE